MLNKIREYLQPKKEIPFHVGITTEGFLEEPEKSLEIIKKLIKSQVDNKIRILSINLIPHKITKLDSFPNCIQHLSNFFKEIAKDNTIHENQIKISILGKWYDLPDRIIEPIKSTINETKDYDRFFLNLCVNYSGQQEIVDSCKLIARKIKAGKIDIDQITAEEIQDNLYSSYFLPLNLLIKNGETKTTDFLLWHSTNTKIKFTNKKIYELKTLF